MIYYPIDTSQGTFGAVAIVPGYTATWAAEGAWMGQWLAQNDGSTTPASILNHYNAIPSGTEKAYLELTGAGHGFPTSNGIRTYDRVRSP